MTVAELIEELKKLPQDAEVKIDLGGMGFPEGGIMVSMNPDPSDGEQGVKDFHEEYGEDAEPFVSIWS